MVSVLAEWPAKTCSCFNLFSSSQGLPYSWTNLWRLSVISGV